MFTKDDLILIQQEAARQRDVALERIKAAEDGLARATFLAQAKSERLRDLSAKLGAVESLLPAWGREADGTLDADRPMLKKDIEAKIAAATAERDAAQDDLDDLTKATAAWSSEKISANRRLAEANAALEKIDAELRSA